MKITPYMADRIKEWEGCRLTAYLCPAGIWTIGYGHTGADVKPGMHIDAAKADALFRDDIDNFAALLTKMLAGTTLDQYQFDALCSLAYNIGLGALRTSTLLKKVRNCAGDPSIRTEFAKWVRAAGRVLPGLVRRRAFEAKRYFGEV